jgi:hypothetical protein
MDAQPEAWIAAKFVLLIVGLLLPGATLMRALRVPASVATSFAGSALALYVTVLALHFIGERISLLSLGVGLGAITLLAHLVHLRSELEGTASPFGNRLGNYNPLTGMGPWVPVYLIFGAAVIWRAWHEPLAGPDVEFRWGFLAEQMLRIGSLNFYPPQSIADFQSYFGAESIPPGVSALHVWAYACADGPVAFWTMPAVVLQLWSVHELLWRLAERIGGVQAARFSCLAAAACPLLTWSILIGQETGLTTIALVGGAYAILVWNDTRTAGWAALAGIFATVGASAREYGLVFPALGSIGFIVLRANWQAWLAYGLAAAFALIWPLRISLLTGNPFYSLSLGSHLPGNERFLAWINHHAAALGDVLQSGSSWAAIASVLLFYAPLAFVGWWILVHATFRRKRFAVFGLVVTGVMLGLWAASVRYTSGEPFYSLHVTSPALVFGCLATGMAFARYVSLRPKSRVSTTALVCLFVIALLPATLAFPANPLRVPWRKWPAVKSDPSPPILGTADESVAIVLRSTFASSPGRTRSQTVVLADSPGYQRRFMPAGIPVIPLWSPQADWLFNLNLSPAEAVRQWHQSRVSFIIVTKTQANLDFFNTRSRWNRPPFQAQLVGETPLTSVFAIRTVE